MSSTDDEVARKHRNDDQISFFATLPSDVDPTKHAEVHQWLGKLAEALTDESHVDVVEQAPPEGAAADSQDPGVWFGITMNYHPICPGKILEPGEDPGDDSGGNEGGDGGGGVGA